MLEKLTKYTALIPLVAIVVYVVGFIVLSSYLQSFGINENIGLDFNILKLGILFLIITIPIVLFSFSTFKVGNYDNINLSEELIINLHDAQIYTLVYSFSLGNILFGPSLDKATILLLSLLFILIVINKLKIRESIQQQLKVYFTAIPFFIFCFSMVWLFKLEQKISLYFLQISIYSSCSLFRIFNKEGVTYQLSKIGGIITTSLFSAAFFGQFLLIYIPVKFGGEKKISNTYYFNSESIELIKKTDLKYYLNSSESIVIDKVYETTEKYYFKTFKNKILVIPKSYINIEEIKIP
ncbi:MAG: hypothetical protein ACRYFL_05860 [Janthinobacterium lividum]